MFDQFKKYFKKHLNISIGLIIGLGVSIIMLSIHHFGWLDQFELRTLDSRYKLLHSFRKGPSKDIIVVGIDDISVAKIGRWPWDRGQHAKMINFLNLYGAKAIFYDGFILYRDKNKPEGDEEFIKAAKNAGNVYLASRFIPRSQSQYDKISTVVMDKFARNFKLSAPADISSRDTKNLFDTDQGISFEAPFFELSSVAKKIGPVNLGKNDDDGIARYIYPVYKYKDDNYAHLAFGLALDLLGVDSIYNWQNKGYLIGNYEMPLDEKGRLIVNWYGKYNKDKEKFVPAYAQYSAWRLIESYDQLERAGKSTGLSVSNFKGFLDKLYISESQGKDVPENLWPYLEKIPADFELKFDGDNPSLIFKDKIVLIGVASTSTTARDMIANPYIKDLPGVFIHANAIDNIINHDFLSKLDSRLISLIILFVGILSGLSVFGFRNSIVGVVYPIELGIIYFIVAMIAFIRSNLWMDIVYVESTIILTWAISSAIYYIIEGKEKIKVSYALSNYLSPQIMYEVLSDPSKLNLGGSKRELSILFADIRGFTPISENYDPQEVVALLNEYFTTMVEIIFRNKGTFDKFIGDAIMAFWNAPVEIQDHPFLAVKAAIEMQFALDALRDKWVSHGKPAIAIGIGINTAEVTVGNIGSDKIKDYTAIGDGVNLASRLEGLNKEYGTSIIISEQTYEQVKDKVDARYIDTRQVKGKQKAVKVYEVLGFK